VSISNKFINLRMLKFRFAFEFVFDFKCIILNLCFLKFVMAIPEAPQLRHKYAAVHFLGLRVRILPGAWMSVSW